MITNQSTEKKLGLKKGMADEVMVQVLDLTQALAQNTEKKLSLKKGMAQAPTQVQVLDLTQALDRAPGQNQLLLLTPNQSRLMPNQSRLPSLVSLRRPRTTLVMTSRTGLRTQPRCVAIC